MFRSLLGFAFPLFGQQMFTALKIGPGNSVCFFFAFIPPLCSSFGWLLTSFLLTASRGTGNRARHPVPYMDILQGRGHSHE